MKNNFDYIVGILLTKNNGELEYKESFYRDVEYFDSVAEDLMEYSDDNDILQLEYIVLDSKNKEDIGLHHSFKYAHNVMQGTMVHIKTDFKEYFSNNPDKFLKIFKKQGTLKKEMPKLTSK